MMKYVTKEEFAEFLKAFPNYTTSITGICEPMALLYHDGEKMIGIEHLYENYPKGKGPYTWEPNTFKISNQVAP